jgi:hypothetical protein
VGWIFVFSACGADISFLSFFFAEDEYAAWSDRYHAATIAKDDREAQIEAVSNDLEQDLRLLGATAIEDRLQDGVPETIADLKKAGIKIWVATGDKLETAIGGFLLTYPVFFFPRDFVKKIDCAVSSHRTQYKSDWPRSEYHRGARGYPRANGV